MKVENFNGVKNQFIIHTKEGKMFQSYDSNVALKRKDGKIEIGKNWDFSKTTGKYRNLFLGETKSETQRKLNKREYLYNENL